MRTLLAMLLLLLSTVPLAAQSLYTVTDLGPALTLGAINPGGMRTVGSVIQDNRQAPAIFFRDGTRQVLERDGRADGIFGDVVVGYAANGRINQEAFVYHPWFGLTLFPLLQDGGFSAATGINRQLSIILYAETTGMQVVPILIERGVQRVLPVPSGGDGVPLAISPQGRVVGEMQVSTDEDAPFHGAYWFDDTVTDMGTLGGDFSLALAVNDTPLATGFSALATGLPSAFTWTPEGGIRPLPALDGFPFCRGRAINQHDTIVGACDPLGFAPSHAVRWGRGRRVVDLNTLVNEPTWLLEEAGGVNNAGVIAGIGRLNGVSHAFLLTPQ